MTPHIADPATKFATAGGVAPTDNQTWDVRVANLDCEHDAAKVERALAAAPGVSNVTVSPMAARVLVAFDPAATSPESLERQLRALGFPPVSRGALPAVPRPWRNPKVIASTASGVLLLAGWLLSRAGMSPVTTTAVFLASLVIGGYFFAREAFEELILEHKIGIEFLMTVAAIVAAAMGESLEGAMLAFLYSMSEAAEGYTAEKTRAAVKALMDLAPKTALVRRWVDGVAREFEMPVEEVRAGDICIVRPGQSMPTDGEVVVGRSSVNQAPVTGESVPVEKAVGDVVFAGTINGEGALEVRATKAFAENTIARIIHMVEEAQERKGASERFIERFGRLYSPAVLGIGILLAALLPIAGGMAWREAVTRATVFIVAAAPCALVISIPMTLVAALGTGARKGVLIKGGVFVEELAKVRVVAVDKTGTLTRGTPEVTDVVVLPGVTISRDQVLAAAAGVESRSQHPLARAVLRQAERERVVPGTVSAFRSFTGAGAAASVAWDLTGRTDEVFVGSPELFARELGVSLVASTAEIAALQSEGKTVIVVGTTREAWALIAIRDSIRPNAATAVRALHDAGVAKVVMLTGDNERTARAIASDVGIDEVYADLTPEAKAVKVRELAARDGHVAMVGDGVNDAPALAEATVGVAMGAAGTDVALETADVALMADDLEKLVVAIRLAQRNQQIVRQNLVVSAVVIGVLIVGALLGRFTLPVAVIGHELSEFVVIASGLRMLRA